MAIKVLPEHVSHDATALARFDNPDGFVNSPGFMTITSAQPDERQVRLGLRVSF